MCFAVFEKCSLRSAALGMSAEDLQDTRTSRSLQSNVVCVICTLAVMPFSVLFPNFPSSRVPLGEMCVVVFLKESHAYVGLAKKC